MNYLVWGRESNFFCYSLYVIMWFLFGGDYFFSWCLGWAGLNLMLHPLCLPLNYFINRLFCTVLLKTLIMVR